MPRSFGHRKGVETTRRMVAFFAQAGIKHLTLFAFSSENWNRPEEEVNSLMELFMQSYFQIPCSGKSRQRKHKLLTTAR